MQTGTLPSLFRASLPRSCIEDFSSCNADSWSARPCRRHPCVTAARASRAAAAHARARRADAQASRVSSRCAARRPARSGAYSATRTANGAPSAYACAAIRIRTCPATGPTYGGSQRSRGRSPAAGGRSSPKSIRSASSTRARRSGVASAGRSSSMVGTGAVVVALQQPATIDRACRANARQQYRQREIARDFGAVPGLPRHAHDERRIRLDRDPLFIAEKCLDDAARRTRDLPPDQLRIRHAVAKRRLARLDFVERLFLAAHEIAPFGLDVPIDDRRHPERAGDQDQNRDENAAAEHRNALVAANGLERAVRHDATRRRCGRRNAIASGPRRLAKMRPKKMEVGRSCQTNF